MKKQLGITLALALCVLSVNAAANDAVLGALLGGGAGAVVGRSLGGRDGTIIGGALGAAAGAAIASEHSGRVDYRGHYAPGPVYYAPAPVYYAPAPAYYAPLPPPPPRRVYYAPPVRVVKQPVYYIQGGPSWDGGKSHRHSDRDRRYRERHDRHDRRR